MHWPRWCAPPAASRWCCRWRATTRAAIAAVADAVAGMDMLVTTGGASVGEHDLVHEGAEERGLQLDFWQIAMRPGKPLLFGRLGRGAGAGSAGQSGFGAGLRDPVPAAGARAGSPACRRPAAGRPGASLGAALRANDHRPTICVPAISARRAGPLVATPLSARIPSMLRRLALADALILRPPHAPALPAGAEVQIIRLIRSASRCGFCRGGASVA